MVKIGLSASTLFEEEHIVDLATLVYNGMKLAGLRLKTKRTHVKQAA